MKEQASLEAMLCMLLSLLMALLVLRMAAASYSRGMVMAGAAYTAGSVASTYPNALIASCACNAT